MDCQQGVSYLCGASWHLEAEAVRAEFRVLAEVERLAHAEAFPGWKFEPVMKPKVREVVGEMVGEVVVVGGVANGDAGADADAVMVPQEGVEVLGDYDFDNFGYDLGVDNFDYGLGVDNYDYDYGVYPQWQPEVVVDDAFLMAPVGDARLLADDDLLLAVAAAAEPLPVMSAQVEAPPVVLCSRCACSVVILSADTVPLVPVVDVPQISAAAAIAVAPATPDLSSVLDDFLAGEYAHLNTMAEEQLDGELDNTVADWFSNLDADFSFVFGLGDAELQGN